MASATNPSDPITLITNRIIALLSAQPFFNGPPPGGIPVGNRFSYLSGTQWPIPPNINAANVPTIRLSAPTRRTIQRNSQKTFSNARSGIGDVITVEECTFLLTFIWNTTDRYLANAMDWAVKGVLDADPKLGLTNPVIRSSGDNGSADCREENTPETGGTLRLVQRIRFPVVYELHRAQLDAAAAYAG